MPSRRIIFIAVALLVSGLTIFLGRSWLAAQRDAAQRAQQQPAAPQPSTMVLVAKGNLTSGQFVRPENLRWQPWPNDGISPTYVVQGQRALEDFIGSVVRAGMSDGEPITEARVVRPGDRGFLAAVLTPGYRAVSINLSPSQDISGFVFPGDHVDLIVTLTVQTDGAGAASSASRNHIVSETVLKDLRVLAVDQRSDDQTKDVAVARTATLEVTPKQAEIVTVVADFGKLSLSLRALARDETEALADSSPRLTYTSDSEATHLMSAGVTVVRGSSKHAGAK